MLFKHSPPRNDIIEDILRFVVKSMSLPIIPVLINKSFVDFLSIADTLQSFREYLSNAIMTTEKMSKIEKYPIASTEIGSKLDAHISPIMDEGFNRKFTEDKAPKKDVTI